ncbi:hypothetical protein [Treponema endosymbiont of Eucomonympha sp.]|uniref:hypothetical protein n=2 Tax=Treponema endosymbiont of Eucomonympha sp. TaxID=1580831 RepID=UPI000783209D|nr:hypothetical protein [Treponema endosymbiont of Eucomonympha sp.]
MMTAKTIAAAIGCSVKTVHNHANALFGRVKNGAERFFTGAQVTAILERIKHGNNNQHDLVSSLQGTETELTAELRLATLYKQTAALERELRLKAETRALEQERRATGAELLLRERERGLEAMQRMAEKAGALLNDRDDLYSAYRGRI